MKAWGMGGSALGREKAGALRLFSDEALPALAFEASAHRRCVSLRQTAHAQAVDRFAVDLRLMHPDLGPVEFGAVFACQLCRRALCLRFGFRRGELNRPPARGR